MTVNQRALFRGLFTWLWLTLGLGIIVQIIEFVNTPEVCTPNPLSTYGSQTCVSGSPTAYGGGLAVAAVILLVSVASAQGVILKGVTSSIAPATPPSAAPATTAPTPGSTLTAQLANVQSWRRSLTWSGTSEVRMLLAALVGCAVIIAGVIALASIL